MRISKHGWLIASLWALGVWFTFLTALSLVRYENYGSSYYDAGFYDHIIWKISQGDWGALTRTYHVEPVLYPLAAMYRVIADVRLLFVVQGFALGVTGIGLHRIASRHWKSASAGFLFTVIYLFSPYLGAISLDFHPLALSIPFLVFAFDAAELKHYRTASVLLLLALFCKEDVGLAVSSFGIYFYLRSRWRTGLWWGIGGVLWMLVALFLVLNNPHSNRYDWLLKGNFQEILASLIELAPYRLSLLGILFIPWLFMPFLRPDVLAIGLLPLLAHLLSGHLPQLTVAYHYPANYAPFLIIAGILGSRVFWESLGRRETSHCRAIRLSRVVSVAALSLSTAVTFWLTTPLYSPDLINASSAKQGLELAKEYIAPNACLVTTSNIAIHYTHRTQIFLIGHEHPTCSLALFDLTRPHFLGFPDTQMHIPLEAACEYFAQGYAPIFYQEGALLLRQGAKPDDQIGAMLEKDCP